MEKNCDSVGGNIGSQQRDQRKLNTKGCCFLCLTLISNDEAVENPLVSLKPLQRYFRISTSKEKKQGSSGIRDETVKSPKSSQEIDNINVELCECCAKIVGSFKDAFLTLEKSQMEVDYWSERVHQQISEGSKKPDQVQVYSKRMTSDPVTLVQLVFVDNLRKDISKKSLKKKVGLEAKICLQKSKWKSKKQNLENAEDIMHQMQPGLLDEDTVYEADDCRHSTLSMDGDYDDKEIMDSPTIATIKEETTDTSTPYTPSPVLLSPSDPQTETKPVPSSFAQMLVKNQKTGSYSCTSCNKQLKSKLSAKAHYEAIHMGKRYPCQICKNQFTQIGSLRKHRTRCNGKKRKSFSLSTIKKWHFNSKTGKYACTVCNKEFRSKPAAYYHYEVAHLKKKHKCEICNMAVFSLQNKLRHHQKTCEAKLKRL